MNNSYLTVWWGPGENETKELLDASELEETLDTHHLAALDRPILMDLISAEGSVLTIGLGRSETVLSYVGPSGDPPYLMSLSDTGDHNRSDTVWFDYGGTETEFSKINCISIEAGRAVVRSFAASRQIDGVAWVEV